MSGFTTERMSPSSDQPRPESEPSKRRHQSHQPRQLLSCTKCRERKVKCDRTKPCSACCARGIPKECHFVTEGGDYAPIQQSYELRKLRAENITLKERLRANGLFIEDEESTAPVNALLKREDGLFSPTKRRPFVHGQSENHEWQDSLYFGSPSLAHILNDINLGPGSASLAYLMPRAHEHYTDSHTPSYPFATLFKATPQECIPQLLSCLPQDGEIHQYLDSFERRVNIFSFPHMPLEITRSEIERFLSERQKNSEMHPDMLALLFAAIAVGGQYSIWDKSGEQCVQGAMDAKMRNCDVFIAASMQALRLASFMHKPSLRSIQTLIMLGPYLTNSGRFLDAWTLFGITIRLAQSIGLHRHPKYLNPAPASPVDVSVRQALWWWMLHMDEQYSMTLGRPLGISGIGDCPWPQPLTTDPAMLRFGRLVNEFTVLARQILGNKPFTDAKIDDFTDSLKSLLDTMPESLQFHESWGHAGTEIPEWPLSAMATIYHCKTHTYIVLLNQQRVEEYVANQQTPGAKQSPSSLRDADRTPLPFPSTPTSIRTSIRGRDLVLSSSISILDAFLFVYYRIPEALIDWTISQQAFNSCMIILLDAIEKKRFSGGTMKSEKAFAVFNELQRNGVHKLATLAVQRIGSSIQELRRVAQPSALESRLPEPSPKAPNMEGRENEFIRGSHPVDTAMGNTGLFLLEDPGLQGSFDKEWTPITCKRPSVSGSVEVKWEYDDPNRSVVTLDHDNLNFQPKVPMDRGRRPTVGLVPMQNMIPMGRPQLRRYTSQGSSDMSTISDPNIAPLTTMTPPQQQIAGGHQLGPTQLTRSNSHEMTSIVAKRPWPHEVPKGATFKSPPRKQRCLASSGSNQAQFMQYRHNSCPTLPKNLSEHSRLYTNYPTQHQMDSVAMPPFPASSISRPQQEINQFEDSPQFDEFYSLQASVAEQSPTARSNISESVAGFSLTSGGSQSITDMLAGTSSQQLQQQRQDQYTFPASPSQDPSSTMMNFPEDVL
ncbi:hypothetical protein IQ07DRAFT_603723 [Pyrenochaeta sp. DS3sAY3a]|nr:hypothetical protein IQ07DRAFT_603723 [Pyrenochaeta sp. DS3sAY3a]